MDWFQGMRGREAIRINRNDLVTATGRKELPCPPMGRLVVEKISHGVEEKNQEFTVGQELKGLLDI